jgi:cystathionine beta-synthase
LTKDDVVVVIVHDHGSRYIGKIYNDDWMRERGFLDTERKVKDLITGKKSNEFMSVDSDHTVRDAFNLMKSHDISQMPVMEEGKIVGSLTETAVLKYLLANPINNTEKTVGTIMSAPFPVVDEDLAFSQLSRYISRENPAVIAEDKAGALHILTQYDIIQAV